MNHRNEMTTQNPEDVLNELRALVAEAEKMFNDSIGEPSEEAAGLLRRRLGAARERMADLYNGARRKVVAGAKYADTTIRENPYQSLGIAVGIGLLVGVLIGRRTQ